MSMLRNLATSLINSRDERIITTVPKAKELRPFVERAITLSRRAQSLEGDDRKCGACICAGRRRRSFTRAIASRRLRPGGADRCAPRAPRALRRLKRLFDELGERFKDRPGGYTRIIKLGRRAGDGAELAIIELVDNPREREAVEAATSAPSRDCRQEEDGEGQRVERGRGRASRRQEGRQDFRERRDDRGARKRQRAERRRVGGHKPKGGSRAKKTEQTAAEQDTD